ncbi:MAG: CHASE2 domain-containing protein, partial [Gallionella sp.]|nr:CHASE2 domain-containing protein [Gallionella sp.]
MEEFFRKRLAGLPLLILVRKQPGFYASIKDCVQGRDQCAALKQHLGAILVSWLIVMLGYFSVLPFEAMFQPAYQLVSQKTDAFLSITAGTDAAEEQQSIPPIELYDIDEATYRDWRSPAIIPRDKLAFLINRAVQGGASVIAVDINLTYPDTPDNDRKLGELLKSLNESDDPDAPVIILTRKLQRPLNANKQVDHGVVFSLPPSFLDAYLPVQKKVFWTSTLFNIDDDHRIRRWRNAEVYCSERGEFALLPSLQLMAAVAYGYQWQGGDPADALRRVEERLARVAAGRKCDGTEPIASLKAFYAKYPANDEAIQLEHGEHSRVLNLADFGEAERINYRIAPVT